MYDYEEQINRECKARKKAWNGKVITTSKQWVNNDYGSRAVDSCEMSKVWDAVRDYYDSRQWE